MATATGTGRWIGNGVHLKTWTLTGTVTKGTPLSAGHLPDKTVTARGVFAPGCTISIEGTNLLASASGLTTSGNWFVCNDTRGVGNALTFATDGGKAILENPVLVRPRITSLTSNSQSIVVTILSQSFKR